MSASDEPLLRLIESPSHSEDIGGLFQVADQFRAEPSVLCRTLTDILADDDVLGTVADRSSVHPNGFAKVVPYNDARARLHVWRSGENNVRDGMSTAHGHRWDFASWVIAGTLRETMFEVDPTADSMAKWHYGRDRQGRPFLHRQEDAGLTAHSERYREAGTVYTRLGTDLHSAEPVGDDPVITLVVQGPRSDAPVPVYGRPDATRDERPLSPDELASVLTTVVDVLESLA